MNTQEVVELILQHYPGTQAIYLFGSYGTEYERPDSDVDLALLLPPVQARLEGSLAQKDAWSALCQNLDRPVDLINLRRVNTVFQLKIIETGHLIYVADQYAAHEFEMLTLSYYQKLQEERAEILKEIIASGRVLSV